jgi:hypothetical protein
MPKAIFSPDMLSSRARVFHGYLTKIEEYINGLLNFAERNDRIRFSDEDEIISKMKEVLVVVQKWKNDLNAFLEDISEFYRRGDDDDINAFLEELNEFCRREDGDSKRDLEEVRTESC